MKPPLKAELFETPISIHWLDENGILCVISKKVERKMEYYKEVMKLYKKLSKNGKLCLLTDIKSSMPIDEEIRNYIASETPKHMKAHAVLTDKPLEGTHSKTFLKLSLIGFPVKVFTNEMEAKDWLREFL